MKFCFGGISEIRTSGRKSLCDTGDPNMKRMPSTALALGLFCALLLLLALPQMRAQEQAGSSNMPAVGTPAPDFKLNSQEGTPVSLHDFKGKWVVLYFYPKDMTTGCTIEAHNFQRDLSQYEQRGAVILGVSVDPVDSHKQFCTKEGLTFKLLADTDHEVSTKYGTLKTYNLQNGATMTADARTTFIIDPSGKIVKVFTGVKPDPHSAEVLATLDQLQHPGASGSPQN
jgi:thioredoxin-dependent peroxiredoxin